MILKNEFILTVIIPAFNTAEYLVRCIESVLNQSLKKTKIVVVDDASTDATLEIVKQYQEVNPRIKCIKKLENSGPGASRNEGLSQVDTKFVCFLDSDDWVDSNAYLKAIRCLEENPECDIAIFGIKTEYDNRSLSIIRYDYQHENIISSKFALHLLSESYSQDICISALLGNKIFRTSLLQSNQLSFAEKHFEDTIFTYQAIFCADKIALLPDIYLHYFQRDDSIMHTFSKKYIDDLIDVFKLLNNFLCRVGLSDEQKKTFYSFFERCCRSTMNCLFLTEQNVSIQKKYLLYFCKQFCHSFPISEYIDYIDINRLKEFLGTARK